MYNATIGLLTSTSLMMTGPPIFDIGCPAAQVLCDRRRPACCGRPVRWPPACPDALLRAVPLWAGNSLRAPLASNLTIGINLLVLLRWDSLGAVFGWEWSKRRPDTCCNGDRQRRLTSSSSTLLTRGETIAITAAGGCGGLDHKADTVLLGGVCMGLYRIAHINTCRFHVVSW